MSKASKRAFTADYIRDVVLPYTGSECLFWPFSRNSSGYAKLTKDGKLILVSRLVCREAHGEPSSPSDHAAHSCGNGKQGCVNPHHISWKSKAANEADKVQHGTSNRGERCGTSKLTECDVREIRKLKGAFSTSQIAAKFGTSSSLISMIHTGRRWGWLSDAHPHAPAPSRFQTPSAYSAMRVAAE